MARVQLPSADRVPGGNAVAGLSRRVRSLIVAGVLFIVLLALLFSLPVPYVVLSPGPTCNTLGSCYGQQVISIKGTKVSPTSGNLNLTTVGVSTDKITPIEALVGWFKHDEVVVPRSSVYPPGTSQEQTNKQNTADFTASQDNATVAALCQLGYPRGFGVVTVLPDGPSAGKLRTGDRLRSVDGTATTSQSALLKVLQTKSPGTTVRVGVTRPAGAATVAVTLSKPTDGGKGGRLGVTVADTCLAPFTVTLGLGDEIGGPSAGLMFALGIIDKLGKDDLTHGRFIAGTGTIDATGKVGPIGGIQLKMIAARRKGATVFLAPAGNCGDVRGNVPDGLDVVKVSSLRGALSDLDAIGAGKSVPGC